MVQSLTFNVQLIILFHEFIRMSSLELERGISPGDGNGRPKSQGKIL